jgi:hypothetical protein
MAIVPLQEKLRCFHLSAPQTRETPPHPARHPPALVNAASAAGLADLDRGTEAAGAKCASRHDAAFPIAAISAPARALALQ